MGRKLEIDEDDLWALLPGGEGHGHGAALIRTLAALDALGPKPCGHPSARSSPSSAWESQFTCVAPKGHHTPLALSNLAACCKAGRNDPIHCGNAHIPPPEVWAE